MKSPLPRALPVPLALAFVLDEDPSVGRILRSFFVPNRPHTRPAEVVVLAARRTDRPR